MAGMNLTTDDLDAAWDIWDFVQSVSFVSYIPDYDAADEMLSAPVTVQAINQTVDYREEPVGENVVPVVRRQWHFRASTMQGLVPKERDTFTDGDGRVWVVRGLVEKTAQGTRYVCDTEMVIDESGAL